MRWGTEVPSWSGILRRVRRFDWPLWLTVGVMILAIQGYYENWWGYWMAMGACAIDLLAFTAYIYIFYRLGWHDE